MSAAHALTADQQRVLRPIADAVLAEEQEVCHRQQEYEQAQAAAAERHSKLTAEAAATTAESQQAISRCEADFIQAVKSLQRVHEARSRERKVKAELGRPAFHLSTEAISRRMSLLICDKIRAAKLPGATASRYGALLLPPLFRPSPNWIEAEQRVATESKEDSDNE